MYAYHIFSAGWDPFCPSVLLCKNVSQTPPPAGATSHPPAMNFHLSRANSEAPSKNGRKDAQAQWPEASPPSQVHCLHCRMELQTPGSRFQKLLWETHRDVPWVGLGFTGRREVAWNSPCSSFTAHTMRSTQAAFAWQRSLSGLISLWILSASWRIFWSSPWLMLNCSNTKSWISFTKEVGKSVGKTVWDGVGDSHRWK